MKIDKTCLPFLRLNLFLFAFFFAITISAGVVSAAVEVRTVAIIGGGVSGLTTAGVLEKAEVHDWVLLEATKRLGGRVDTHFIKGGGCPPMGCPVEDGSRYMQGIQRNPLYEIFSKDLKMRMHHANYNKVVVYDENSNVDTKPPFTEFDKAFGCTGEVGTELNEGDLPYPLKDGRELFEECDWFNKGPQQTPVMDAVEFFDIEFEFGRVAEECSAYAFPEFTYVDFRDADYYPADDGGWERLTDHLKLDILGGDVRLDSPVEAIHSAVLNATCRDQTPPLEPGCVMIELESNHTIYAQWVVSTIPLGVIIERAGDLYPNAPPEWKNGTVPKFIMGGYHSTYLKFKEKFWEDTEFMLTAAMSKTVPDGENDFVVVFKPYDNGHPQHYWPGSKLLQANVAADTADYFDELCKNDKKDKIIEILTDRLNAMYKRNDTRALIEDEESGTFCTKWSQKKYYRGAWSQWGPTATPTDYAALIADHGNLIHSGEHTCRRYYGFVHAALLTGWRDGNRILENLNKDFIPENRCEELPSNNGKAVPRSRFFKGGGGNSKAAATAGFGGGDFSFGGDIGGGNSNEVPNKRKKTRSAAAKSLSGVKLPRGVKLGLTKATNGCATRSATKSRYLDCVGKAVNKRVKQKTLKSSVGSKIRKNARKYNGPFKKKKKNK